MELREYLVGTTKNNPSLYTKLRVLALVHTNISAIFKQVMCLGCTPLVATHICLLQDPYEEMHSSHPYDEVPIVNLLKWKA